MPDRNKYGIFLDYEHICNWITYDMSRGRRYAHPVQCLWLSGERAYALTAAES